MVYLLQETSYYLSLLQFKQTQWTCHSPYLRNTSIPILFFFAHTAITKTWGEQHSTSSYSCCLLTFSRVPNWTATWLSKQFSRRQETAAQELYIRIVAYLLFKGNRV